LRDDVPIKTERVALVASQGRIELNKRRI